MDTKKEESKDESKTKRLTYIRACVIVLVSELAENPDMKKVTLLVDAEEPFGLRDFFLKSGLNVEQTRLPVGDYWLIYDGHLLFVFERKTLGDINGAIFRRHAAQYWCLCQLPLPRENINYLVVRQDESKIECFKGMDFILKELGRMSVEQGIHSVWTESEEELQLVILQRLELISRKKNLLLQEIPHFSELRLPLAVDLELESSESSESSDQNDSTPVFRHPVPRKRRIFAPLKNWASYTKISRGGNHTPASLYETMLGCIPGMGSKADSVIKIYPSFAALHEMTSKNERKSVSVLQSIRLPNGRNLGPAMAEKIVSAVYSGVVPWASEIGQKKTLKRKKSKK